MAMYRFNVHVQARPVNCQPGETVTIAAAPWPTLVVPAGSRAGGLATFDAALSNLERLPRMFMEPDGALLWVGDAASEHWQVDGNLYDRGDELAYISLQGSCPSANFDEVLRCFGPPTTELIFQLRQAGVWVDEPTFRTIATAEANTDAEPRP